MEDPRTKLRKRIRLERSKRMTQSALANSVVKAEEREKKKKEKRMQRTEEKLRNIQENKAPDDNSIKLDENKPKYINGKRINVI